jgi:hypothetical protein
MDATHINTFIQTFVLNQRSITCQFRKAYGLFRTDLEILVFANSVHCFNTYEVHIGFREMNMQQIRTGIKKLAIGGYIELIGHGKRNSPSVYMITRKGKCLLDDYSQYWINLL